MLLFIVWIVFIHLEQKMSYHKRVCRNKDVCCTGTPFEKKYVIIFYYIHVLVLFICYLCRSGFFD